MTIQDLGFNATLEDYRTQNGLEAFEVGRVITEHRERYTVYTSSGVLDGELLGNLRYPAESREDLPAVGDWVALSSYDEGKALIHAVYPRHTVLARRAVGKSEEKQIIATNIDVGLIVQSVNRDFNINRIERYLTICYAAGIEPMVLLSKTDLLESTALETMLSEIAERIKEVEIIPITSELEDGYRQISNLIEKGKTYCLLGSSGVGKSTLLNHLSGKQLMDTGEISESIDRGKHVTTHRELVVLDNGGILIDNPGMREVGIADATGGLEMTFDEIAELAQSCRYKDCTHLQEEGCAILEALEEDELDQESYNNYLKMYKEKLHYETSQEDKKRQAKGFGKMMKQVKKVRKQNKY